MQILQQHGVQPGQEHIWHFLTDAMNKQAVLNAGIPSMPTKDKEKTGSRAAAASAGGAEEEEHYQQPLWWLLDHGPVNALPERRAAGRARRGESSEIASDLHCDSLGLPLCVFQHL